jgi:hypothetical protein
VLNFVSLDLRIRLHRLMPGSGTRPHPRLISTVAAEKEKEREQKAGLIEEEVRVVDVWCFFACSPAVCLRIQKPKKGRKPKSEADKKKNVLPHLREH